MCMKSLRVENFKKSTTDRMIERYFNYNIIMLFLAGNAQIFVSV